MALRIMALLVIGVAVLWLCPASSADVPPMINYQGQLTNAAGAPINGTFDMTFRIYPDTLGSPADWSETQQDVEVTRGIFSVLLGSVDSIPALIFDGSIKYLGVQVESDPQTTPLNPIVSVPYAFHSEFTDTAEHALSAPRDDDWEVDTAGFNIYRLIGNVGIGTPIPQSELEVVGIAQMTGFKMPTDAASGYVLTSDASGVGTWQAAAGGGDVTAVYADEGLTGGATSGDAHLNVGQGTGILVSADAVSLNTSYTDDRYVNEGQSSSITGNMIVDNAITDSDISGTANIAASKISGTAWTATNDGSGSGLDADMVDGYHALAFLRLCTTNSGNCQTRVQGSYSGAPLFSIENNSATYYSSGLYAWGNSFGLYGEGTQGVYGICSNENTEGALGDPDGGVYGAALAGGANAGYFDGDVQVTGNIYKANCYFKIDHPVDPENKYLYHSSVESPDLKNVYDGTVVLDVNGEAKVELPEYFEALNRDFRYQLTCIGDFAPVYVAEEISANQFSIAGGRPGIKISWQVTGIRKDPFAEANAIQVEVEKPGNERGKYLHPQAYGLGEEYNINYEKRKRMEEKSKESDE